MSRDPSLNERLAFMELDSDARGALRSLGPMIDREIGPALAGFYDKVRATPETRAFFADARQIDQASARQQGHWRAIAKAEFGDDYGRAVKTVGQVHARIGLEPRWYIGGYALVAEHLMRAAVKDQWPKGMFGNRATAAPRPGRRSRP
jgi:methyl-accepting chemotaxis protein